jgi:hypothetical protein
MNKWMVLGLLMSQCIHADDYHEGRQFALNAQSNALSQMSQIAPGDYLNQFTDHPVESGIDPQRIPEEGRKKAAQDETAQHIIASHQTQEKVQIDLNSEEMLQTGHAIDTADEQVSQNKVPCIDGACLPETNEPGDDFGEGITQLGSLAGAADDVSARQVHSGRPNIFTGSNYQCRKAVAGIGNCCEKNGNIMRCNKTEKALAAATKDSRSFYVGTYCAMSKLGICLEYKESWCVFPSKLASIIQIQGRKGQLNISFGTAKKKKNRANCRGISPEELSRINFQALNLFSLTEDFKSRGTKKPPENMDSQATQKIERMEGEGRAHG